MAKNSDLNRAAKAKKDEFYTQLSVIEKEMRYYKDFFSGKVVFCNCDDPFESNFFKYFAMNFNALHIKKLIATCYVTSPFAGEELPYYIEKNGQISFEQTADTEQSRAYKVEITEVTDENGDGRTDLTDVEYLLRNRKNTMQSLEGDGDFRSEECIALLKESDVVVTNPPFSLFREFIAQLVKYEKHFLIIGNVNAITYKEVFPLIMQNKLWLGASIHSGDREFRVPDSYPLKASGYRIDENGVKYIRVKGVRWFTNIDYAVRHEKLVLYKQYHGHEDEYPKYDNYDAINVDKTSEIPCDYFADIGVPITYLDKHNPDQFEIVAADYDVAQPVDLENGKHGTGRFYLSEMNHTSTDRPTDRPTDRNADYTAALSFAERCNGIIGVPITFLDRYCPDQFELVGATESEGKGFSNGLWNDTSGVAQPVIRGERKYKRLFIRYKL